MTTAISALGMAAYCFARMEWDAVYCSEKLKPGFVFSVGAKTAGAIANDIISFGHLITDHVKQSRYRAAANDFARLVRRRNDLMHANPATIGSEQRLVRHGIPWQPSDIDDLADQFAACSFELNELYHRAL